ncbi:MAG: hypothetical protein GY711_26840 [bacterium]|nr:hypothetical protein [bacterium]
MGIPTADTEDEVAELKRVLSARETELSELREAFGEFASAAGHELKSPLNKMIAFVKLLQDEEEALSEDARENLGFLVRSANKLRRGVDQLLDYARAGRVELEPEDVELDRCVDLALRFAGAEIEAAGSAVDRDELPTLHADMAWLAVALRHLIDNVAQHAGGAVRCRVTAERDEEGWTLGVRDWGVGVEPQHRERIFQPFERAHGAGSGLGLPVAARIIERHGGRLWLESPEDGGAHFRFRIG